MHSWNSRLSKYNIEKFLLEAIGSPRAMHALSVSCRESVGVERGPRKDIGVVCSSEAMTNDL